MSASLPSECRCSRCDSPRLAGQFCAICALNLADSGAHLYEAAPAIERYETEELIGVGGMGEVWRAVQLRPIRRIVAVKVIKLGMDTKEVVARFEQERQALALMDHAAIAKVFEAGATKSGRPFFAMELVEGVRITEYCDNKQLSTHARLKLFMSLCGAIQHAHQKGIVHRDIKPSNVLVSESDGIPTPKVIDFGVAKATQGRLTELTLHTQVLQVIGTPLYMSPEQAAGSVVDVDTRSDIYSLGVLLFELLTGQTPISSDVLLRVGLDEIRQLIQHQESPRPSVAVNSVCRKDREIIAGNRRTALDKFTGLLRGDLDAIVLKALEKDPARRYKSVDGLAMDIQRHLSNQTIIARPGSKIHRMMRTARRHRAAFFAVAGVFLAVLIGGAVATWQALRAQKLLSELEATAPTFAAMAERLASEEQLSEAIAHIEAAIALDPENPKYLLQKADLLQVTQKLEEAVTAYRQSLAHQDSNHGRRNLALCEKLILKAGAGKPLSLECQIDLAEALLKQNRHLSAAPLCKLIGREADISLPKIRARFEKYTKLPEWNTAERIRKTATGVLVVLSDLPLLDLPKLDDLLITELYLNGTQITNIEALRGLKLVALNIDGTVVSDLRPLEGMPLRELRIERTNVIDLTPLKGAPLESLNLWGTGISNIDALQGAPLKRLQAGDTKINNLAPLSGAPLERLYAEGIPADDFNALATAPLIEARLGGSGVKDLAFISKLPLKKLYLLGCQDLTSLQCLLDCKQLEELSLPIMENDLAFLEGKRGLRLLGQGEEPIPVQDFWRKRALQK